VHLARALGAERRTVNAKRGDGERQFCLQSLHPGQLLLIIGAMVNHRSADIRNFAIVGHASSGKTVLSEAMLACNGTIKPQGTYRGRHHCFGIGVGTERVVNFDDHYGIPKILVVNTIGKQNANFEEALATLAGTLASECFPSIFRR
jgi:translation elongation factor EF-G